MLEGGLVYQIVQELDIGQGGKVGKGDRMLSDQSEAETPLPEQAKVGKHPGELSISGKSGERT